MNQLRQGEGERGAIKSILISLGSLPIVDKTKESADEDPNSYLRNVKLKEVTWWNRTSFRFGCFGLEKLSKGNVEFAEQICRANLQRSFPLSRAGGERRNKRPLLPPFARI